MLKLFQPSLKGAALVLAMMTCASVTPSAHALSKEEKRALVGAVIGGLAGSLASNGDPWATAGGALAGGVIGNVTTDHDRRDRDRHSWDRRHRERLEWERRERERKWRHR